MGGGDVQAVTTCILPHWRRGTSSLQNAEPLTGFGAEQERKWKEQTIYSEPVSLNASTTGDATIK
jgi:hypothetical protein